MAAYPSRDNSISRLGVETAKGGAAFTTASIVRSASTLVTLIVLARLLLPSDFGLYSIVLALVTLLGMNTDYGVGNALKKYLASSKRIGSANEIISSAYLSGLSISLLIAVGLAVSSGYIAKGIYGDPSLSMPIQAAALVLASSALFIITASVLLGLRKSREASAGFLVHSVTQPVFSIAMVLLGYGIPGAIFGMALGYLAAFAVSFALLVVTSRYRPVAPKPNSLARVLSFGTPIFVSNAANNGTRNFGLIFLGLFVSSAVIGNYGAAFKLGSFGDVIIAACLSVLLPAFSRAVSISRLRGRIEKLFNGSLYYTLLFLLPLLAYLICVSKPLIFLLFSASYVLAPLYFSIIAIGIVAGVAGRYAGTLVVGYGMVKPYAKLTLLVSLAIVLMLLILTPTLNVYGTLIVLFVASPLLFTVAFLAMLKKEFGIKLHLGKPARLVAASLLLGLLLLSIAIVLGDGLAIIALDALATLMLYPPLIALFKAIDKNDIDFVREVGNAKLISWATARMAAYTEYCLRILRPADA
ncbi:MAG: oligosaccharide flippase family protein [Candidatus Micrarchaeota archaeon]|nr:oligosaccharide flippase family protein [Candidatus Micrarchaeota archaeon]